MNDEINSIWKEPLWGQFGAAIDMFENAMRACPDEHWANGPEFRQIWYISYHTLFFLDFYLDDNPETYTPLTPFGITELDERGILPERVFTKNELLGLLAHCREKSRRYIHGLTTKNAELPCPFSNRNMNKLEFLFYNLRHVQHHAGQLNLLLRQTIDDAPKWVGRTRG